MKRFGARGFTLLELLVVMSLLSVIMLGLVSSLRGMAQTEAKIDERLRRLDEIRTARAFLLQSLGRVSATKVNASGASGARIYTLVATPDSLVWVGILPARPNIGGRHFFRLALESKVAGHDLVLRYTPWIADVVAPDWKIAETSVLVSDVSNLEIQGKGLPPEGSSFSASWSPDWRNGWPETEALPEQLRLKLADSKGELPDMTVPVRLLPQSAGNLNLVVIGGSPV